MLNTRDGVSFAVYSPLFSTPFSVFGYPNQNGLKYETVQEQIAYIKFYNFDVYR